MSTVNMVYNTEGFIYLFVYTIIIIILLPPLPPYPSPSLPIALFLEWRVEPRFTPTINMLKFYKILMIEKRCCFLILKFYNFVVQSYPVSSIRLLLHSSEIWIHSPLFTSRLLTDGQVVHPVLVSTAIHINMIPIYFEEVYFIIPQAVFRSVQNMRGILEKYFLFLMYFIFWRIIFNFWVYIDFVFELVFWGWTDYM
jgi:hypothetical protein